MFIINRIDNQSHKRLGWEIVNLSRFDSIVIRKKALFEVRARRIRNPNSKDITIVGFETREEADKFVDFLFAKLDAGCQTTDLHTLLAQVEEAVPSP